MQSSIRKYSFYINHAISLIIIDFDRSVAEQKEDELDPNFSYLNYICNNNNNNSELTTHDSYIILPDHDRFWWIEKEEGENKKNLFSWRAKE